MWGGVTGLGILERALASMLVLTSTYEGGTPPDIKPEFYKISGYPPQDDAEYLRQQLCMPCEPDVWSET